jgi:transcriptional regulator with XRE-family HTH domain
MKAAAAYLAGSFQGGGDMGNKAGEFIGSKLRRLRQDRGYSAADLQRLTNGQLGERTIWKAEVAGTVTQRTARLLAPLLGVQPEDLLADAKGWTP